MEVGTEIREIPSRPRFQLQTPREFRDDFVAAAKKPKQKVGLETMQFEVCDETRPIFESLLNTPADNVMFHSDRVAGRHIAVGDSKATVIKGVAFPYRGRDWVALQKASNEREELMRKLKERGIGIEGEKPGHFQHNHAKLAIVDDIAWFGTMNLRALDFQLSNFMMRVEDPHWVGVLKDIFDQADETREVTDQIFKKEMNGDTELLLDAGERKQSAIFQRAHEMVRSMNKGDSFTYVGQWPPVRVQMGSFLDEIHKKAEDGVRGTFLMSPEDQHHPIRRISHFLQRKVTEKYAADPNIDVANLPRGTHAKVLLITRANGEREALFGSHNLTSWTVRNGTRELSMWTKDPSIVDQVSSFIDTIKAEKI